MNSSGTTPSPPPGGSKGGVTLNREPGGNPRAQATGGGRRCFDARPIVEPARTLRGQSVTWNGDNAKIALVSSSLERLYSRPLATLLRRAGGIDIQGACGDIAEDLERFLRAPASRTLFVSVESCTHIGTAALLQLRKLSPATDWVLVWPEPSPRWHETALYTQARGGVAWDIGSMELQRAIDAMDSGELWFSRAMMQALYVSLLGVLLATPSGAAVVDAGGKPGGGLLTTREAETMMLIRRGLNNKQIAARLGISVNTVKKHLSNAFEKRGLHSRRQLLG